MYVVCILMYIYTTVVYLYILTFAPYKCALIIKLQETPISLVGFYARVNPCKH